MPTVRWSRLDLPGEDEATLGATDAGRALTGRARFKDESGMVDLAYVVQLRDDWTTRSAEVRGTTTIGPLEFSIASDGHGAWTFDGVAVPRVAGCLDFDLGFSPSTNLTSVRRLNLALGERAEVIAAWIPFPDVRLEPLRQFYHRVSETEYAYECPEIPFSSRLTVDADGFVTAYPPLWAPR